MTDDEDEGDSIINNLLDGDDPSINSVHDADQDDDDDDDDHDFRGAIMHWMEGEESRLEFPPALTPFDRRAIHEVAEGLGLRHRSIGTGERRRVVVQRRLPARQATEAMEVDQLDQENIPPEPEILHNRPRREPRAPAYLNDYVR